MAPSSAIVAAGFATWHCSCALAFFALWQAQNVSDEVTCDALRGYGTLARLHALVCWSDSHSSLDCIAPYVVCVLEPIAPKCRVEHGQRPCRTYYRNWRGARFYLWWDFRHYRSCGYGVVAVLIISVFRGEASFELVWESLMRTLKSTGTIIWVTIGAAALAGAYTIAGGPQYVADLIVGLDMPAMGICL